MTGNPLRIMGGLVAVVAAAAILGTAVVVSGGDDGSRRSVRPAGPLSEVVLPADRRAGPSDRSDESGAEGGSVEGDAAPSGTNDAGDDPTGISGTTDSPSTEVSSTRDD
ncbi:MAG TPA: hypothetical protein VFL61_14420, partial [Gaiellaceae bacterium]|nr:hypothetical protein [Gaiellaceae bacterium]